MKKIIYTTILVTLTNLVSGQVALGKTSVNGDTTILDFYDSPDNKKGIILPAVNNVSNALASTPSDNNGTFLFDKSDKKVKMYENSSWVNLSGEGNSSQIIANASTEGSQNQGVIIGADSSDAKGVLVLEAEDKAMILPKIATPHTTVKSPYPGMMCYDTISKTVAVFDGTNWNYWR